MGGGAYILTEIKIITTSGLGITITAPGVDYVSHGPATLATPEIRVHDAQLERSMLANTSDLALLRTPRPFKVMPLPRRQFWGQFGNALTFAIACAPERLRGL